MFRILIRRLATASAASHPAKQAQATKSIADISPEDVGKTVRVRGWVTAKRSMKNTIFLDVNDGSGVQCLQVLAAKDANRGEPALGYGASIDAQGVVGQAPSGQLELKTDTIRILGI